MEQLGKNEARKQRLIDRNNAIVKRYDELSEKKYKNVKVYSTAVKLQMVADEFFLAARTIEEIIFSKKDK